MAQYVVEKSPPLAGETAVQRSKNAVLPMMACGLMTRDCVGLSGVPRLTDVDCMASLLGDLGAQVTRSRSEMSLCGADVSDYRTGRRWVERMRASVLVMGPLLARLGRARIQFPGGCAIGSRPIDLHLKGFAALGAHISLDGGCIEAQAQRLHGAAMHAEDLRGAMALVVGALQAEEESTITGIKHLRRGYDNLEENLRALGADVKCVEIC